MAKRKAIRFILSSFLALGFALFSGVKNNDYSVSKADDVDLVGTPDILWNNVVEDNSFVWSPTVDANKIPQQGYALLAKYPTRIAENTHYDANLVNSNITGCNVSDHILINGVQSRNVPGVTIYCYPEDGLFIYVPKNSFNLSDDYQYLTIQIVEGLSIDGSAFIGANVFEFKGSLGTTGNWQIKGEFTLISWNNVDYSYKNGDWCGDLMSNQSPEHGYCLLVFFNEVGKASEKSKIGTVNTTGRGVIGHGLDVDHMVKANGVNIADVVGSICYIYPQYGLFFYIPDVSLTYNDTYIYPVLTIESGLHFNDVYLPSISFEFRGEIGQTQRWTYIKDASEYNHFPFTGVAVDWNNVAADATHNHSVLQFGENTPSHIDYLRNNHISEDINQVDRYSDCGKKISVNGVPLCEIEETVVSYIHGYGYVYIVLPISVLQPSNGYKVVTLHIEANTIFYDSMLPEVNLYLFNGKWTINRPETPDDSDYDDAFSFSSTFGQEQMTLNSENNQLSASKTCSIDEFGLFMDYKLKDEESAFVLYAAGGRNQSGLRVVFRGNTISLYDATQGNTLLGTTELELFNYDEWYSLFLYTRVISNHLSVRVAIDDITYIHAENVNLANRDNIGNLFSLNLGNGVASFKNATLGGDNKKPVLSYSGKSIYSVLSGSDVIDFTNKCSAFDVKDGDVTNLIEYKWPVGAITDNKINKGVWEVNIVSKDKSNNVSELTVTVVAADKLDVTVTFDGENPVNYRVGDHIACVTDPVKEGNGTTKYRFIGWYYNDRLWDFENDYVIADMNLVSKYQETVEEYCVTFTVEGLAGVNSYTLYFEYGTKLNMDVFMRDGYTLKAYVDDSEVESITVSENMTVKLVYESTKEESTKKGCKGSVASSLSLISILSGVGFILLVSLKKKGGKKHE